MSFPKSCFLYLGMASILSLGMHLARFDQLNLVALQIMEATKSLPSFVEDAVLSWTVGDT